MSIRDAKKVVIVAGGWRKIPEIHKEIIRKELGKKRFEKFIFTICSTIS